MESGEKIAVVAVQAEIKRFEPRSLQQITRKPARP
jgi:hypothetical protein